MRQTGGIALAVVVLAVIGAGSGPASASAAPWLVYPALTVTGSLAAARGG
jgi:hypothetical protein